MAKSLTSRLSSIFKYPCFITYYNIIITIVIVIRTCGSGLMITLLYKYYYEFNSLN